MPARTSRSTLDRAMLRAAAAALACLFLARSSPAESHGLRVYQSHKDLPTILAGIEERLRVLDTISAVQMKQSRRLDVIQEKLDHVETTLSLRFERAQLAAERLEHRLHMLQTSVQVSLKESVANLERSQKKIGEIAQNLTNQVETHRNLLEKVNGAYTETWRRGLLMEKMMRDGLALVNVTRRELADGLRALARRQRDARLTSADLEASFARRLNDNTFKIDLKMQEVLDAQKRFIDSCQRVQQDDPKVTDALSRILDSLINKIASTFHELQTIQVTLSNHDKKMTKLLSTARPAQSDAVCKRLEMTFRNASHTSLKESELQQLTEKFVALTNRADAALQQLESRLNFDVDDEPASNVPSEADKLLLKLKGIKNENSEEDDWDDDAETGYFDDGGGGDMMDEDKAILSGRGARRGRQADAAARPPHRRHLHKHPYDRGPHRRAATPNV